MSKNTLDVGERRVGYLIGQDLGEIQAVLERTDKGIVLTVSWASSDVGPLPTWFRTARNFLGEQEGEEKPTSLPRPPRRIQFRDSRGFVTLLGCRGGGYTTNVGGPGTGRVLVQHIVLGSSQDHDFSNVTGLRTTLSHLRAWVGTSSWTETATSEGERTFRRDVPENIDLGSWGGTQIVLEPVAIERRLLEEGGVRLESALHVKTSTSEPTSWERHLRAHQALRDLLVISGWNDEVSSVLSVHHPEDTQPVSAGKEHRWWRDVAMSLNSPAEQPKERDHLLTYEDLQVEGLRKWFALRERFKRAIDPVVSSITLRSVSPSALLAQVGPGVEALGYELMRRDGMGKKPAGDALLSVRFQRILDDVGEVIPFDGQAWAQRTARTYNGIKHANRTMPDNLEILNVERECVLIIRAWCALELGVDPAVLKERVANDKQAFAWIAA